MSEQAEFKSRFFAVLEDLQQSGTKDGPTMWLLGSLAADLAGELGAESWSSAKGRIDQATFDTLLRAFRDQGNAFHRDGRNEHAYAIQVLTVSLMAATQRQDPHLAQGETLMDAVVDGAMAAYRRNPQTPPARA